MLLQYETRRLVLKLVGPEYAPEVLRFYLEDKELFEKYEMNRSTNFYTENHQHNILHVEYGLALKLQQIRFYAFLKEDPEHIIGTVCLYDVSNIYSRAELGYKFSSKFHHQGYASEAVERILDTAFLELNLHRVTAHVQEDNEASIRLLKGLGFTEEGICRDYLYLHGRWQDHIQYSILSPSM